MTAAMDLPRVSRPRSPLFRTVQSAALAFLALPLVAHAQVRDVESYKAVVLQNATPLRCDNSDKFYRVAELSAGTILTVDGESADWVRVAYPGSVSAYVAAEVVDFNAGAKTARLKEANKLKASNFEVGIDGSWKSLLLRELPAGSELKVLDGAKSKDGKLQGYRVVPPESARGYVAKSAIRKATPEELAKASGSPAPVPAPTPPVTPAPVTAPTAATPPTTTPAPATEVQPQAAPPVDLTQPVQPATIDQKSDTEAQVPAPTPELTPEPVAAQPRTASALDLESTFQQVRREDVMTAEVDELMAAYERLISERPIGDRRRRQMEQRVEALKFMQDLRNSRRAIEAANLEARQTRDEFQKKMNEYDMQRQYAIVGLLTPSSVYDGKELPLMYRLQTVGGSTPRTLGYIKPTPELNLASKLGVVVGVVGENKFDSSLRLNVIEAVRVDNLQAASNPIRVGN